MNTSELESTMPGKNNEHSPIERENSQALLKQNIASNYYLKEKTKGPAGSKRQSVWVPVSLPRN